MNKKILLIISSFVIISMSFTILAYGGDSEYETPRIPITPNTTAAQSEPEPTTLPSEPESTALADVTEEPESESKQSEITEVSEAFDETEIGKPDESTPETEKSIASDGTLPSAHDDFVASELTFPATTKKPTEKTTAKPSSTTAATKPAASKITKLTKGKKRFTVKWKKVSGVTGYQIQYSTSRKFSKKTTKTKTVKGAGKSKAVIKKLKKGKKYYVRVRTYKVVNGAKQYSKWSAKKAVKTK